MKRFVLVIAALGLMGISLHAQYRSGAAVLGESEISAAMRSDISFFCSNFLDGRLAGSEGEAEAADYLADRLEELGVTMLSAKGGDLFGMKQEGGDTLTSRNVVGYIPGYDKDLKDKYILIGARLDNIGSRDITVNGESLHKIFPGANGNASGLAMLIQLAGKLSSGRLQLRRSVLLVGFGSSLKDHAGAWYFLNRSFPDTDNIEAMVNLDMLGTGAAGMYAYTASNADMNAMLESLSRTLQPVTPKVVAAEPCDSDHRAFYDRQIPSVFFTTGRYPEYMTDKDTEDIIDYDDMERELEYLYNFSISICNGPKPMFDPHKEAAEAPQTKVFPYYDCDRRPTFLGSADPRVFMEKWVYQYLRYPSEAVRQGIQGKVLVDFVIDEKGRVTDVKVLKGVHEMLDAEAERVIAASPAWKPGYVRGKKVKAEMSLYVEFRLEKRK